MSDELTDADLDRILADEECQKSARPYHQLVSEVRRLRAQVAGRAERIAAQSELLARHAERSGDDGLPVKITMEEWRELRAKVGYAHRRVVGMRSALLDVARRIGPAASPEWIRGQIERIARALPAK